MPNRLPTTRLHPSENQSCRHPGLGSTKPLCHKHPVKTRLRPRRSEIGVRWGRLISALIVFSFGVARPLAASPRPEYGRIELIRDTWGIPHVFAGTDAGALYGLGHATAEERGFQMTYALRIMQGRLAEVIGDRPREGRRETAVLNDRRMRTFGWARAAARTAAGLDPDTRSLLEAYSEGVNASFAEQKAAGRLHPLFARLGVEPEPWTPADCLLSWWHVGQFFATDGTRDLLALRNRDNPPAGRPAPAPAPGRRWFDDEASVVRRGDVTGEWLKRVETWASEQGFPTETNAVPSGGVDGPRFSHAWVVGGRKSGTGAAVLVSDPQTPVRQPSLWMEFHLSGKTMDARGVGVPGSPGLLIGFNRRVAWGLTALGADQADLFRLETSPDHPDAYRWDGQWRAMNVRREIIRVKGGADVTLTVRETHWGPVVSEFCFRQEGDPEVALKRVPICETDRETIQGVLAMMRARDADEFSRGAADWRFPSANCVFGDANGQIGYAVIGAIPVRPREAPDRDGNLALPGTAAVHDWRGFVPADLLPALRDPAAGLVFSANHRPVGAFYPLPLGLSTGSMGDTIRSWRLRERLTATDSLSPLEVLDIHGDTVNPARRELVRLGLHVRATRPEALSPSARQALEVLEPWLKAGASSDLRAPGADLATRISTFFRFVTTPLATTFGGGESGLARFLKDTARRLSADPRANLAAAEVEFVDRVLTDAWRDQANASGGRARENERGRGEAGGGRRLAWFDSLDGFGSLDRAEDLATPGITCLDGQTLHSQAGQSYTQWVPLHDVDAARTVCPIGHSDRPDSPWRKSTLTLWGEARLHPAPLGRAAVEKIAGARRVWEVAQEERP